MNYKMIINILGKVLLIEAFLLLFPFCVGLIYDEQKIYGSISLLSFLIPIAILILLGCIMMLIKPKDKSIFAKEGFVVVALSWVILSLVGSLPIIIYLNNLPEYYNNFGFLSFDDALFETVSGFTTTGASVFSNVEVLPNSINFWRLFTHWIGGMGVLVFVLAILPNSETGTMHIFRAESPGPTSSKIVSKMKFTARILYLIYVVLTLIEFIMLSFSMPIFDAVVNSFATAGTGGFSIKNNSIAYYSNYSQWVIAMFMFIFSINFNLFYMILIGRVAKAIKSEEFIVYVIIVFSATLFIALYNLINNVSEMSTFGSSLRLSFFQVTSLSSSTGFSTTNYDSWPEITKVVLLFLMLFGACAGSTGGGMKIARLILLTKSSIAELKRASSPRAVVSIKFEGEPVDQNTIKSVRTYFVLWFLIVAVSTFIVAIGGNNGGECDILSSLSASIACIGNIGPGFNLVGPYMNYGGLSAVSKIWLSFVMLAGRLEIVPMLILFSPRIWKKK